MTPDAADGSAGGPDDLDELIERSSRRGRRAGSRLAGLRNPLRRRTADEVDDELDGPPAADEAEGRRRRVYWRARDSLWFEPLVALAIIVVLLVSLFAYTSNWPPVYVVESNSMQHGNGDHLGVLNAGDVVLAQRASTSSIVPYFAAVASGGPSNYGEPGDVLLYYPDGQTGSTPVVHRALLFLEYDRATQGYNATTLAGLPCTNASHPYYYASGTYGNCGTSNLRGTLILYHVGWKNIDVTITFTSCAADLGAHSGYLTLGDNNTFADQIPGNNCAGQEISQLVAPGWVIGVARGLLPWFGALKLFLDGNSQLVPSQSWEYLGLSIAGIVLVALGVHLVLKRLGVQSETRRREERRQERRRERDDILEEDDARPPPVRAWRSRPAESDDEFPDGAPSSTVDERRRAHVAPRPRPRRPHGPPAGETTTGDEGESESP